MNTVDLLERTVRPCPFENKNDILEYLHSDVEVDNNMKNDGYVDALDKVAKDFGFANGVELNIYIERKLLEYEYTWKDKENIPKDVATEYITLLNIGREDRKVSNFLPLSEIINEIEQLAIGKGILLPQEDNSIAWAVSAIKLLANSNNGDSTNNNIKPELNDTTTVNENSDTALRDLRFAHAYLTRQYTEHVQSESTRLRDTTSKLQQATQRILDLESEKAAIERDLNTRARENHELTLQNALLKVDSLGTSPTSTTNPLQMTPPASADTPSVRILRAQFKRQVEDLHEQFATEMERLRQHYEKV